MHELAITQSVVDLILDRTAGRRVGVVRLQVGRLSGVVPDALRFCFDLATSGTSLDGAALEIEQPMGEATCRSCGSDFEVSDLVLLCPCGSADVRIVAGTELRLISVEVAEGTCA